MSREYDPKDLLRLTPKRSYTITGIDMIGNYALQPTWDDGHHTGIYTWDYLKRLCPRPATDTDAPDAGSNTGSDSNREEAR